MITIPARSYWRSAMADEALAESDWEIAWYSLVCRHENTVLVRAGLWGRVACQDCGYSREWNAY